LRSLIKVKMTRTKMKRSRTKKMWKKMKMRMKMRTPYRVSRMRSIRSRILKGLEMKDLTSLRTKKKSRPSYKSSTFKESALRTKKRPLRRSSKRPRKKSKTSKVKRCRS